MKILMASTGALFVLYVLLHMYGNLKVFAGQEAFDHYAEGLRELLVPIMPYSGVLWLLRILLLVSLGVHAYAAFYLWSRATNARSTRYAVRAAAKSTGRSHMMRWGGVALLLYIVFHLIQFTIVKPSLNSDVSQAAVQASPYAMVVAAFQLWWVTIIYLVALAALGMHLFHGVWSGAQTLGWTGTAQARKAWKATGGVIAVVTAVGFALPPLAILAGIVK